MVRQKGKIEYLGAYGVIRNICPVFSIVRCFIFSKCNINVSFTGGPTGLALFLETSFIFGNVIFCFDLFHNGAMGLNLPGLQFGQLLFM